MPRVGGGAASVLHGVLEDYLVDFVACSVRRRPCAARRSVRARGRRGPAFGRVCAVLRAVRALGACVRPAWSLPSGGSVSCCMPCVRLVRACGRRGPCLRAGPCCAPCRAACARPAWSLPSGGVNAVLRAVLRAVRCVRAAGVVLAFGRVRAVLRAVLRACGRRGPCLRAGLCCAACRAASARPAWSLPSGGSVLCCVPCGACVRPAWSLPSGGSVPCCVPCCRVAWGLLVRVYVSYVCAPPLFNPYPNP